MQTTPAGHQKFSARFLWRLIRKLGLRSFFSLLYMVRVPVLALTAMVMLGVFANTIASDVLANLFDQGTSLWGICAVCFSGFLHSAVCVVCINMVVNYGGARCGDLFGVENHSMEGITIGWIVLILGAIPSFVFAGFVWHGTTQLSVSEKAGPTLLALTLAAGSGLLAKIFQLFLWDGRDSRQKFPPDMVIPLYPFLRRYRWYRKLKRCAPLRIPIHRAQFLLRPLQRRIGPGYFYADICKPANLQVNSGHIYVAGIFLVSFGLWFAFGKCEQFVLQNISASGPILFFSKLPALAWVVMLMMVATLTLAGLSFFLDRYRIPFLWLVIVLSFGTGLTSKSDHFFEVSSFRENRSASYWTPGQILQSRIDRGIKRFVVVSTAGGGIQAAAWTAKVLDGLSQESASFRDSVLVISSVSGGSVGAMAFARTFDQTHPALGFDPVKQAKQPALDAAAWGWTVPDVWRAVEPWTRRELVDRGWALERAWTPIFQLRAQSHELQLTDWAVEAHKSMPALLLNASVVETGHPVVFTTSRFADQHLPRGSTATIYNFHSIYGQRSYTYDVSIATATRLSASFPFVAPAARPNLLERKTPDLHYVDGGYYDNYGITTLFAWLEKAMGETACADCKFLLLRITHFPDPSTPPVTPRGWLYQLYAPLQGLYEARDAGQLVGDNNQVRLEAALHPALTGAAIQFRSTDTRCSSPPLSWQLSLQQQNCIDDTWNNGSKGGSYEGLTKARQCVNDFLAGGTSTNCENLATEGLAEEAKQVSKPELDFPANVPGKARPRR